VTFGAHAINEHEGALLGGALGSRNLQLESLVVEVKILRSKHPRRECIYYSREKAINKNKRK